MKLTNHRLKFIHLLAKPLVQQLRKHGSPMIKIIITQNQVLVEETIGSSPMTEKTSSFDPKFTFVKNEDRPMTATEVRELNKAANVPVDNKPPANESLQAEMLDEVALRLVEVFQVPTQMYERKGLTFSVGPLSPGMIAAIDRENQVIQIPPLSKVHLSNIRKKQRKWIRENSRQLAKMFSNRSAFEICENPEIVRKTLLNHGRFCGDPKCQIHKVRDQLTAIN